MAPSSIGNKRKARGGAPKKTTPRRGPVRKAKTPSPKKRPARSSASSSSKKSPLRRTPSKKSPSTASVSSAAKALQGLRGKVTKSPSRRTPSKKSPSTGSVRTAPKDIRSLRAENDELKAKVEELTRRLETKEFNMRAMNFHMTGGRSALKLKASKSEIAMMKATEQECMATVDVMASWMHTVVWPQKNFCLRSGPVGTRRETLCVSE